MVEAGRFDGSQDFCGIGLELAEGAFDADFPNRCGARIHFTRIDPLPGLLGNLRSAIGIILCVMSIPARVHFCWIGPQLSWAYAFALLSAAAQAGMDEVVLHHTDELEEGAVLTALRSTAGLRLERIDARDLLAEAGARLGLSGVLAYYR